MLAMWHIDSLPWKYQYFSTFGKFRHFPPKSKCSDVKTNKFYKTWTKLGNNSRPPDSRTPLFKVRKPPFSTINENNTINDNKERHETSSEEHDTDGEDKEVNEPRSATPRSVQHWEYGNTGTGVFQT